MGKMNKLPDRWLHYIPLGRRIPGTRFIAFKVPLSGALPKTLAHLKIFTAGKVIPDAHTIRQFQSTVTTFLTENADNDKLIGVHCTHGLNRTGYLVCRYLIDVEGMDPDMAIEMFQESRGHLMERQNFIQDLQGKPASNDLDHKRTGDTVHRVQECVRNGIPSKRAACGHQDQPPWFAPAWQHQGPQRFSSGWQHQGPQRLPQLAHKLALCTMGTDYGCPLPQSHTIMGRTIVAILPIILHKEAFQSATGVECSSGNRMAQLLVTSTSLTIKSHTVCHRWPFHLRRSSYKCHQDNSPTIWTEIIFHINKRNAECNEARRMCVTYNAHTHPFAF
ncbi:RNA/RNP complex-1-interacting phosphatase isoform X3 [Ambystoma mexicanum]|uniref:RNA/RNP complex-1-interacting phosphatase isoform X3 n=1 Tax=Ambystoma mexicanum TaxID=8296 RepID=UPI0037E8F4FA